MRDAYRQGYRRVCLVSPTGSGKTVIFTHMSTKSAAAGKRVMILAHREQIVDQISDELHRHGVEHGVIAAGRSMSSVQPVHVGMMMTVAKRLDKIPAPDFLVVDEAHRARGTTYMTILKHYDKARSLLVTATPQRTDGRGLRDVADVLVEGPNTKWLIDNGHLAKYRLYVPPPVIDFSKVRTTAGDLNQGDLQEVSDKPEIAGDALEHYKKIAEGRKFVVFTTGTAHSRHIAEQFTAGGVPTRYISGTQPRDEIKSVLNALRSGEILGVSSCNLISEGFDLPGIEAVILLRRTESIIVYLQQVGRGLRPAPDKEFCLILDHVGNSIRYTDTGFEMKHGLPDTPREWSLDGRDKTKKDKKEADIAMKLCEACFGHYPGHMLRCPYCNSLRAIMPHREIEVDEKAELREATADEKLMERFRSMSYDEAYDAVTTIDEIRAAQKARGHKPGWVIKVAKEKLGADPRYVIRSLDRDFQKSYFASSGGRRRAS